MHVNVMTSLTCSSLTCLESSDLQLPCRLLEEPEPEPVHFFFEIGQFISFEAEEQAQKPAHLAEHRKARRKEMPGLAWA